MLHGTLVTLISVFCDACICLVSAAEMDDNVERIKRDLHMFLYHLRLPAEVFVVPLVRPSTLFHSYFLSDTAQITQKQLLFNVQVSPNKLAPVNP